MCAGSEGDAGARRAQLDPSLQPRSNSTITSASGTQSASDYTLLPPPLSAVGGSAEVASAARLQLDFSLQSLSNSTSGSGIQSASNYPLPPLSAVGGSAEVASAARLQLPPGCNLNMGNVLAAHLKMIVSSNMDVKDVAASSPVPEVGGGEVSVPTPPSASLGLCRHQESDLDDSGRTCLFLLYLKVNKKSFSKY